MVGEGSLWDMTSESSPPQQQRLTHLMEQITAQGQVLTIPRPFVAWTGDHITALVLSQIISCSVQSSDPEGWFAKSAKAWEAEVGISAPQLARATKKLAEAGVSTRLRKIQGAPTLHYRIDEHAFGDWIAQHSETRFLTYAEVDCAESEKSDLMLETDEDRTAIERVMREWAHEFGDPAAIDAAITRVQTLYRHTGLTRDAFLAQMEAARQGATERASGRTRRPSAGQFAIKPLIRPKPQVGDWVAALQEQLRDIGA
jgi:hypothetical protein